MVNSLSGQPHTTAREPQTTRTPCSADYSFIVLRSETGVVTMARHKCWKGWVPRDLQPLCSDAKMTWNSVSPVQYCRPFESVFKRRPCSNYQAFDIAQAYPPAANCNHDKGAESTYAHPPNTTKRNPIHTIPHDTAPTLLPTRRGCTGARHIRSALSTRNHAGRLLTMAQYGGPNTGKHTGLTCGQPGPYKTFYEQLTPRPRAHRPRSARGRGRR